MKKIILSLAVLLLFSGLAHSQKFTLSGYVHDAATGEKLIGANVFSKSDLNGTITNAYGFYSFSLPTGEYELYFSYVGYETKILKVNLIKDLQEVIELQPAIKLEEVVVTSEAWNKSVESTQMSSITINVQDIKSMPALLGEVDVIKFIQLLPGVQSGTEGAGGLYVRGGGPDQSYLQARCNGA